MLTRLYPLALFVLLLVPAPARAWIISQPDGVALNAVATDPSGDVAVAGRQKNDDGSTSWYVAYYTPSGVRRWTNREDPGSEHAEAFAVAVDGSGDVYVTGTAKGKLPDGDTGDTFVIAKYSGFSGNTLWRTVIKVDEPDTLTRGSGLSLMLDGNGYLAVGGYLGSDVQAFSLVTRVSAGSGRPRWIWEGPTYDHFDFQLPLDVDHSGNVFVAGDNFVAARLNAKNGKEVWRVTRKGSPGTTSPIMTSIAVDRNGDVAAGGVLNDADKVHTVFVTRLKQSNGKKVWEFLGTEEPDLWVTRVRSDSQGNVFAGGLLQQSKDRNSLLRLSAAKGHVDWTRGPFGDDDTDADVPVVTDLALDGNSLFAVGNRWSKRFRVAAFDRSGNRLWDINLDDGFAAAAATSRNGNLYVIGKRNSIFGDNNWLVLGLNQNGTQLPAVQ